MSESAHIPAGGGAPDMLPASLRGESWALLKLGGPMALTQLIQYSIYTVDTVMIGRVGPASLAAAAVGGVVYFLLWMVAAGPVSSVTPMVSQALGTTISNPGASARRDVRRSVRMALWLVFLLVVPMTGILFFAEGIFLALGQDAEVSRLAAGYVLALAPGLPFALAIMALRNFLAALDKTTVPLVIVTLTVLLNAGLNAVLIFGLLGAPALGLLGAGIASSIAYFASFALFVLYIRLDAQANQFDIFRNIFAFDRERFMVVAKLSWPISLTTVFEGALFNAAVVLMGIIGVMELAAFNVGLNFISLAFMVPWGMSMAGAVRIGLAEGAADEGARLRATQTTIFWSAVLMGVFALIAALAPLSVVGVYMDVDAPKNAQTVALITSWLPIAAAFMVIDAVQVAANQLLRGLKDVRAPMFITGVSYWLIGFPLCYGLALHTPLGPLGVWYGLMAGLAAAMVGLGTRLALQLRRPPRPPDVMAEALS